MYDFGLSMAVVLDEDGGQPVLLLHAPDLRGDEVGGFVPGDALVLADAAVLRVAAAWAGGAGGPARVPVHAFEGIEYAVGRVDAVLVGQGERGDEGLHAGFEHLAPRLHAPGLHVVLPVEVEGADADDLAVLDVHLDGVPVLHDAIEAQPLDDGALVLCHVPDLVPPAASHTLLGSVD